MSVNELLTYVEELTFKTSMFGYDKDEVDIQLDKICDEIENIVKEKDSEISELRSGVPAAPVIVEARPDEEEGPAGKEDRAGDDNPERPAALAAETEDLRALAADLQQKLQAAENLAQEAEKKVAEAEKQVAEAEERAIEAEKKAAVADGRLAVAETRAAAAEAERKPQTTEEAYEQYLRNADLLCMELSDLKGRQDDILSDAQIEAGKLVEDAKAEAEKVLAAAREEAGHIVDAAEEKAAKIGQDAQKCIADAEEKAKEATKESEIKLSQLRTDCDELSEKKKNLAESFNGMIADIQSLIDKIQVS